MFHLLSLETCVVRILVVINTALTGLLDQTSIEASFIDTQLLIFLKENFFMTTMFYVASNHTTLLIVSQVETQLLACCHLPSSLSTSMLMFCKGFCLRLSQCWERGKK